MDLSALPALLEIVVGLIIIIYVVGIIGFILLDNRTPQSTFAWLFLLLAFPVVGLFIYLFFGRSHRAFSNDEKLARNAMGVEVLNIVKPLLDAQDGYSRKIAKENPASYDHRLLKLVKGNSSSLVTAYNDVEILQNATEKYPRLMEDIRNARHSIHLLYFIWTEDEFTIQVKDALIERAKAGVKIRALVDESNFAVSKQYQADLRSAGVDIRPYKVFKYLGGLHNANYRSHRKIVVVDGTIGFVGGMNLDKEQLPGYHPLGDWRDTHLRITGEGALALQLSFAISWFNTTGEKILDPTYYPPVAAGSKPFTPVQITQSGPDSQWKAMQQLYFFMINSAVEKCYIQSPFFIPDPSLLEAIKAAALAGVDVRIICTPRGGSYQLPYRAAYTYFADVVRAGAKVYLYNKGYFHCKTIMVDSKRCAVGTANFDIRSFSLNYETMAVIYDEEKSRELETDFMNDIQNSVEWKLEDYEKSPLWRRLFDSIDRLASPIL
jgi:cardiolipin synthase